MRMELLRFCAFHFDLIFTVCFGLLLHLSGFRIDSLGYWILVPGLATDISMYD